MFSEIKGQETLRDFINYDSLQMFHMLQISNRFLDKPVDVWEQDNAYLNSILQVLKIDADSGTLCRFDTVKFKRL